MKNVGRLTFTSRFARRTPGIFITLFILLGHLLSAENNPFQGFIENKGQWHESVKYRKAVPNGFLFMEAQGWSYYLSSGSGKHAHASAEDFCTDYQRSESAEADFSQVINVEFRGSNVGGGINPSQAQSYYHNFFLGEQEQWAPGASEYQELWYCDLYDKVDLKVTAGTSSFKYDAVIYPGGDPTTIAMDWKGAGDVYLLEGKLIVETAFGQLIEQKPFSYQIIEGDTVEVASRFKVTRRQVSFEFPDGYDAAHALVVDPLLIFSTYSGSTADNWGNTACFDRQGNTYAGGIIFGASTGKFKPGPGVFQQTFEGKFDVVLMKFDSTGSDLLFATYLGGEFAESPVSLIVNSEDDLVVLGITSSLDFPVTAGAWDTSFNGGDLINPFAGISNNTITEYTNGTDIFVSVLSPDGMLLKASTFLGGSGNDGILPLFGDLTLNYGDQLRGEVNIDESDNIYIASSTTSADIPLENALFPYYGGDSDALLVKMNKNLTAMLWGTFAGGDATDAFFSVKPDGKGGVYAAGGTSSLAFPFVRNGWQPLNVGEVDGYIIHVNETPLSVDASTLMGSSKKDQVYFIDLDTEGNVYAVGQTKGQYPLVGNVYRNPGSGQFLHKFSPDLKNTIWSTVFGSGTLPSNISPTAFLVSNCNKIYISGWGGGGQINQSPAYGQGNTFGLPTTSDAFQTTTDGQDFYLMVLKPDAEDLLYATYFGSTETVDHVDGGTSRFDKRGVVYHAVCADCEGNSMYPATENAWSETNNSARCNLAVFKFDLSTLAANFATNTPEKDSPDIREGCAPFTFLFENTSVGGEEHFWSLGDGTTSTNPDTVIHTYAQPGTYEVTLRITDPNTCISEDVIRKTVIIKQGTYTLSPSATICHGDQLQLQATGGTEYVWQPARGLSANNVANPVASPTETTTYFVTITNDENGCTFEDSLTISVLPELSVASEIKARYSCAGVSEYEFSGSVSGADNAYWDFGDGTTSTELHTTHIYAEGQFTAQLIGGNALCQEIAEATVGSQNLFVPNAFSPNGDQVNDRFEINWLQPVPLKVLDRSGNLIYANANYTNQWDGGQLPAGMYFYEITLPDQTLCNGWVHLMR